MTRGEAHVHRLAYRGFVWNLRGPKEMHLPLDEFIINVYCEICEPTRQWPVRLCASKHSVHLVDGFPVPVCHFRRAHFSQVFRGEATFGHCASKAQTYCGFKAMLLTSDEGGVIRKTLPCLSLTWASTMRSLTWTCPPSRAHAWATKALSARFSRRIWQARASTYTRRCPAI